MKQELLAKISSLEAELANLKQQVVSIKPEPEKTKEERFWELILQTNQIKIDKGKYPDYTFGLINDQLLWEYDSKNRRLWLSTPQIWSVFESEYGMKYVEIQSFIKKQVEEYFKCKGIIPQGINNKS